MAPKLGPHAANMAGSTSRLSYDAACVMLIGVSNQIELSEVIECVERPTVRTEEAHHD